MVSIKNRGTFHIICQGNIILLYNTQNIFGHFTTVYVIINDNTMKIDFKIKSVALFRKRQIVVVVLLDLQCSI